MTTEPRKPYITHGFLVDCTSVDNYNSTNGEIEAWLESAAADGYTLVSATEVPGRPGFSYCRLTLQYIGLPEEGEQRQPFRVH